MSKNRPKVPSACHERQLKEVVVRYPSDLVKPSPTATTQSYPRVGGFLHEWCKGVINKW